MTGACIQSNPCEVPRHTCVPVADPGGGVGGLTPLPRFLLLFFCLLVHVYENSRGPGP